MIKHLHIGRSDIIGRYYASLPNTLVISHNELSTIRDIEFSIVSISAFNPARKNEIIRADDFIDQLCQSLPLKCNVIYFSSARVLDFELRERHAAYVDNKNSDEMRLREFFPDLSVVYLPLILPLCYSDKNFFLETFFKNLKAGSVVFDVAPDSSWNFIHPSDLKFLIQKAHLLAKKQLLVSRRSFTGHDFVRFARHLVKVESVEFGSGIYQYPVKSDIKTLYGKFDFFKNFDWLDLLYRMYR